MSAKVPELNDGDFKAKVLDADGPVLVDFGAAWCPPCKALAPIVEQLATELEGRLQVFTIDADKAAETAGRYGIRGLPTILIFKNGQPVERLVGMQSKKTLRAKIDGVL